MSLLQHIHKAIDNVLVKTGNLWHKDIQPWLTDLLDKVIHAEVEALIPLAREAVSELAGDLKSATTVQGFIDAAGQIVISTAEKAKDQAIKTSGIALLTAVTAAIGEQNAVTLTHATLDTAGSAELTQAEIDHLMGANNDSIPGANGEPA